MSTVCDDCGLCCFNLPLPPFVPSDPAKVPQRLLQEMKDYAHSVRYCESHPCFWLDLASGKCKHYELRPIICRNFATGCPACDKMRREAGLQELPKQASD